MKLLFIEGTFHCKNQLITHSWINCGGAFRETVGISHMYNACRLWHIVTDYLFTDSKDKGEVIGSLPPHNDNAIFNKRKMSYVCIRKSNIYPKTCYTDRNDHTTMIALLPVLSDKFSIVGIRWYYGGRAHWYLECCSFGCLKCECTWIYNGALLRLISLGFMYKQGSSTLTSGGGGK